MTPGYYRLQIYRGDSQRWQFRIWHDEAKTQPYDLTGATPKAELRSNPDGVVCASLVCAVTLPNIVDATLTSAASELVVNGVWDLELTYPSGDVVTPVAGVVHVTPDATR